MNRLAVIISALFLVVIIIAIPADRTWAWVGLELDGKTTAIADPYGARGAEGHGSVWELSGRFMYQESSNFLNTEFHWLGQWVRSTGDIRLPTTEFRSPFRSLDMEKVHSSDEDAVLRSEIDRLLLTFNRNPLSLTMGRQAISWGEAYYFNIGDLFGAFPVTETNRRYKPGIDAVTATFELGPFSNLSLAHVPVDSGDDCVAAHILFPLGQGTASLTSGRVLKNNKAGAGYTIDVAGTQVYGSLLFTEVSGGEDYSQAVIGAQRQVDPYTSVVGELYRNGWGTSDPDDYPDLILTDEYTFGSALTLGRYNLALQMSRQVTPLVTLTPAVFGNLSDGSALLRMDGILSISDYTDMTGGLFIGLGKRPDEMTPMSEYGGVPVSIYIEVVHNI